MRLTLALLAATLFALVGCGGTTVNPNDTSAPSSSGAAMTTASSPPAGSAAFNLTSPAFADDTQIPAEYSCKGRNVPPPLRWQHVPSNAESLALVVDDPDAPGGRYVHWVVTGIPLPASEIVNGALPKSAVVSLNSGHKAEYLGPCPPAGTGVHHYRFQLFALRKALTLDPSTPVPESATAIDDVTIAVARTVGLFGS